MTPTSTNVIALANNATTSRGRTEKTAPTENVLGSGYNTCRSQEHTHPLSCPQRVCAARCTNLLPQVPCPDEPHQQGPGQLERDSAQSQETAE